MNREIIFRGKRTYDNVWIYGNLITDSSGNRHIVPPSFFSEDGHHLTYEDNTDHPVLIEENTIGQYTGLEDRNGKQIFDGDILLFGEKRLVVWWNQEAFQWQAKKRKYPFCHYGHYDGLPYSSDYDNIDLGWIYAELPCTGEISTKIIGNIYDNPELMGDDYNND